MYVVWRKKGEKERKIIYIYTYISKGDMETVGREEERREQSLLAND